MRVVISLLLLANNCLQAQQVQFAWVRQLGGNLPTIGDAAYSMAYDDNENVFICGQLAGSGDLDPGPGVMLYNSFGSVDAFVIKLDANGNFLWARQMGGADNDRANAVATDASGNVYIAGQFSGTSDFDYAGNGFKMTTNGEMSDGFITKLDGNGTHIWTKPFGGIDLEMPNSIKADPSGSVYCTGTFNGMADFDPGPAIFPLNASTFFDNFVLRLDPNGNFLWAVSAGADGEGGPAIAIDGAGNAYIGGAFNGTYDFDPGAAVQNLSSAGGSDIFVLKLSPAGNLVWVRQMSGSSSYENAFNIALDAGGNVFVTGDFLNTVDFDPGPAIYPLTSFGDYDIFVCKLDNNGNFLWARQMGGTGIEQGLAVATDQAGNVYTTGNFRGTGDYDPGNCVFNMSPADTFTGDIFLSKLDPAGNFLWAKQMGGSSEDNAYSIAIYPSGNIYMAGYFRQATDFDPALPVYQLTALGNGDGFIHKMTPCTGSTRSTITISTCRPYTVGCTTYTTSGVYTYSLPNSSGCDSLVTMNLLIGPGPISSPVTTLNNCGSYTWNGKTYSSSGTYKDTLLTSAGCDSIATLQLTVLSVSSQTISRSICIGQQYEGHTGAGTFIDTLTGTNGCDSIRTLHLSVMQFPNPNLGGQRSICAGDSLTISPGEYDTYRWQDGSIQKDYTVKKAGLYTVTVTNTCGSATDGILVTEGACGVWFPSAFTPNNDGRNDLFRVIGHASFEIFQLSVYNRWGQRIFFTTDPSKGWDGRLNGQQEATGIFAWHCTYKKADAGSTTNIKGTVTVIR